MSGGAIALGHPIGQWCRVLTTLLYGMKARGADRARNSLPGGGNAVALSVEAFDRLAHDGRAIGLVVLYLGLGLICSAALPFILCIAATATQALTGTSTALLLQVCTADGVRLTWPRASGSPELDAAELGWARTGRGRAVRGQSSLRHSPRTAAAVISEGAGCPTPRRTDYLKNVRLTTGARPGGPR